MKALRFFCVIGVLLALLAVGQPAQADMEFLISCEGTLCAGGGLYAYQYTLLNTSVGAVTLTDFFVGSDDSNIAHYTFILPPAWTGVVIPNDGTVCSVTYTSTVLTPHGGYMLGTSRPSLAVIHWTGTATIPPAGTFTFAYINTNAPIDQEWYAYCPSSPPTGWTVAQVPAPIAGPLGTFTIGYIHGPSSLPVPVIPPTWGAVKGLFQ